MAHVSVKPNKKEKVILDITSPYLNISVIESLQFI